MSCPVCIMHAAVYRHRRPSV